MWKKKLMTAALLCSAGMAYAFMPQAGTWVVTSEVDGKPGRGLAMDVQNDTLLMQMYAYEANSQPTFYLAVGKVVNNAATAPLVRYTGGRFFGSNARSGVEAGSAGNMTIRFTSGTTGFVQFPNETEKAISRFQFGYPAQASSLRGLWVFNSIGSGVVSTDVVDLTQAQAATANGNGLMASANNLFGCEHQIRGTLAGNVVCVWINSSGALQRGYVLQYSVNEGEGYSSAANSSSQQLLVVRRLTDPRGVGTGLTIKSEESGDGTESQAASPAALGQALELLATQGLAP
ncbi:hypothetical protein CLU86_3768 [Acidovorax sp. 62]|uniref:hypothetical protein n=1 Tax=Acidovorax sp. 62 TaxID=2035203 RepID=UPI000C1844F8|nr:hypothetical protein [Acidovorax sp. 62]PIF92818.1 hypothetical protein CLU86_3768 [Acidovorax sp. 62]